MMTLNPYLSFNGNCAEAFQFYEKALSGKVLFSMTWGQAPPDMQMPGMKDKIMHTTMKVGDSTLQGADTPQHDKISGISVALDIPEVEEAERVFAALSAGGTVQMPIAETFWAKRFGMTLDKFGIPWMINCSKPM
jgi:PhnB protein